MAATNVRLQTEGITGIEYGHIPYSRSVYWSAPHEEFMPAVEVFMTQGAYLRCCAHAGSDLEREVGGWLVGQLRVDHRTGRRFAVVEHALSAPFTEHGPAFLTFTHDSQVAMRYEMEARYPDAVLLGWYHTHPRMGIFFSGHDTWMHTHFFPGLSQIALVIEPVSQVGGFFIRQRDGSLDQNAYFGFSELTNKRRSVVFWKNLKKNQPVAGLEEGSN
jgi:proteasome lid subunit RPN8/RPN11